MNDKKIDILYEAEYVDTISANISNEKINRFNQIKDILNLLKTQKLITNNEWYDALIFTRELLNLPLCK